MRRRSPESECDPDARELGVPNTTELAQRIPRSTANSDPESPTQISVFPPAIKVLILNLSCVGSHDGDHVDGAAASNGSHGLRRLRQLKQKLLLGTHVRAKPFPPFVLLTFIRSLENRSEL
jgi:hypothetical protein